MMVKYDNKQQSLNADYPFSAQGVSPVDGKMRLRIRKEYAWRSGAFTQTNEVRYVYDGMLAIQMRGASISSYTRGLDMSLSLQGAGGIGGLLAQTASGAHSYYHSDGNGNVTYLMKADQSLGASYRYDDAYGNVVTTSGTLSNPFRFSNKEWLPRIGLYYYGYRFYYPSIQRWLNRDPIGEPGFETLRNTRFSVVLGEPNRYEFIHSDPLNRIDPVGLWQWGWPPWGNKKDKKCKDCEKQDNPAKDLFKTAADTLAGEVGGKTGAMVRLIMLAGDAKQGCGDMNGAADTCADFARDPDQAGCLQCCHSIMNSFPNLGGFSYFECHAICSKY